MSAYNCLKLALGILTLLNVDKEECPTCKNLGFLKRSTGDLSHSLDSYRHLV